MVSLSRCACVCMAQLIKKIVGNNSENPNIILPLDKFCIGLHCNMLQYFQDSEYSCDRKFLSNLGSIHNRRSFNESVGVHCPKSCSF